MHLQLRLYASTISVSAEGGVLRQCAIADGYLIDELSIQDSTEHERPAKAVVVFDESVQPESGSLKYESRWVDPDSQDVYPGSLRLTLPFVEPVKSFVREHNFHERPLILSIAVEGHHDQQRVAYHIGPHDDGEYVWEASVASQLHAEISWLAPDLKFQKEELQTEELHAPTSPHAEALQHIAANVQAGVSVIEAVRNEIRVIRLLVFLISTVLLVYAIAKAI